MTQPQVAENPVGVGAFTSTIVLEELFAAAVLAAYTAWLAEVAKLMLGLLPVDPNVIWSLVPSWQWRTRQLMKDLENIARLGWEAAARDLGVDAPYDVTNPVLQDQLRRTRNFLVHTPDDVYTMILRVLDEHAGDPAAQTRAVENVLQVTGTVNWPARAKTVAVTEVNRAFHFGSLALAMQVQGRVVKQWIAKEDRATRPTHAEADGQQRQIGRAHV